MQPVRQLHHNDAYFFSHGQEELSQVLRLDISPRGHPRYLADLAEPGFSLNNAPDRRAEPVANLLKRDVVGVLNSIVQETCSGMLVGLSM